MWGSLHIFTLELSLEIRFNQGPPPKKKSVTVYFYTNCIKWYCKQFLKNYNGVNEEKSQTPQSQLYDLLRRTGASYL